MEHADRGTAMGRGAYVRLVVTLGLLAAIGPVSTDTYLPAFPDMATELATTNTQIQATLAGSLIGLGLGQLVSGPLSDALGRRLPVISGMIAHILLSIACALATDVTVLIVLRVLQGLAGTAAAVTALAVVRDLFTGQRAATVMSRLMLVMGLAPVLAPMIGGVMLNWTGWRGTFVFLAAFGVVMLAAAVFWLPETHPAENRMALRPSASFGAYAALLRDPVFVAFVVMTALVSAILFSYIAGSSFIVQELYGIGAQGYAMIFGLIGLTMVVGGQLNPVILTRVGLVRTELGILVASVVAAAVLVVAVSTTDGIVGFVAPMMVVIGLVAMHNANITAMALHRQGRRAGTAAAFLGAVRFGIGGAMAPIVGLATSASAVPLGWILLVCAVLALGTYLVVRPRLAEYLAT